MGRDPSEFRVCPKSNDSGLGKRKKEAYTQRYREGDMKTEIEGWGDATMSQGGQEPPEMGRSKEGFFLRTLEVTVALPTP